MKKFFAGIVLPVLAATAVIGSGFSIWFFGENQDRVSADANVEVENMVRIGNLTMNSGELTLHLDQTKAVRDFILDPANGYVSNATNGNADRKSNYDATAFGTGTATNGIYLTDTTSFDGYISYDQSGYDLIPSLTKYEIVTTFEFTGAIKNYVGVNTTNDELGTWTRWDEDNGVYEFKWKTTDPAGNVGIEQIQLPMNSGDAAGDNGFKFEYLPYDSVKHYVGSADAKRADYAATSLMGTVEPHNNAEYIKLKSDVKNSTEASKLSITTVATLVEA